MAVDPSSPTVDDPDAEVRAERPAASPLTASRYGRTRRTRRQNVLLFGGVAAAFVLVFAAWVIWVAFDGDSGSLQATDVAHTVIDDRTVSVTFEVVSPVGQPLDCAVQALNERSAVVGWKVVSYPASDAPIRTFTEQLRTTELATTGLIYRCWLS